MTIDSIATRDLQNLNENIFLQVMLKSMRMGQHFLEDVSPLSADSQAIFENMLDGQYAVAESKEMDLAPAKLQSSVNGTTVLPEPSVLVESKATASATSTQSINDFVKSIWPHAKQAASLIGLDPKILIAQAALETGWGKFIAKDTDGSTSNNLFNIKTGTHNESESVLIKTTEYVAGTPMIMNASFRKYVSVEHSFNDYVTLIKGSERYQNVIAQSSDPERYIDELDKAGYATDPQYGAKILSIYHSEALNHAMQAML
ncbi:MAG: glucosaminidase domain-containing protein [Legionellales bacterium]